jgi:hypothetical protein
MILPPATVAIRELGFAVPLMAMTERKSGRIGGTNNG